MFNIYLFIYNFNVLRLSTKLSATHTKKETEVLPSLTYLKHHNIFKNLMESIDLFILYCLHLYLLESSTVIFLLQNVTLFKLTICQALNNKENGRFETDSENNPLASSRTGNLFSSLLCP